ncbi:MAG: twin transmembrane helix small protein [Gammaproteobacteria bacterium]|nr:twin transmembrane helix small protein [Gammaproteobacteria bacterium]MDH5660864.1 twin transmembrane helix small protein [Gammaproteobacteria bacterium]
MFKIAIVSILLFIIFSLGAALFAFVKKGDNSEKMLKALTYRIALSIGLIIFMMLGAQFGLISPHGI